MRVLLFTLAGWDCYKIQCDWDGCTARATVEMRRASANAKPGQPGEYCQEHSDRVQRGQTPELEESVGRRAV